MRQCEVQAGIVNLRKVRDVLQPLRGIGMENRFRWFTSGFPLSGLEALCPFAYPFKTAPAVPDSA